MTKMQKKLWTGLLIMALISPLGILLPKMFGSEGAWGEWGTDTLETIIGFVPEGMRKSAETWKAPLSDYSFGAEGSSTGIQMLYYIVSGILGMAAVVLVIYIILKIVKSNEK